MTALGVREQGHLIGAVRLRRAGSVAELGRLAVAPDRQGQGVGSFLLSEAEEASAGVDEIRLFTGEHSTANLRLHERRGYLETGRSPSGNYSLVHLVKTLS